MYPKYAYQIWSNLVEHFFLIWGYRFAKLRLIELLVSPINFLIAISNIITSNKKTVCNVYVTYIYINFQKMHKRMFFKILQSRKSLSTSLADLSFSFCRSDYCRHVRMLLHVETYFQSDRCLSLFFPITLPIAASRTCILRRIPREDSSFFKVFPRKENE